MKHFSKRIIAGAFAVVTLFLSCVPSSAVDVGVEFDLLPTDLWSWLNDLGYHTGNFWGSFIDKDVCPQSSKPGGRHNYIEQRTTVDGKTGMYYICEYCGKSAGEVGNTAYDAQVSEMPATGYASDGSLLYSPVPSYMYTQYYTSSFRGCPHYTGENKGNWTCSFDCASNTICVMPASGWADFMIDAAYFYYDGVAPVDGYYTGQKTLVASGYYDMNGSSYPLEVYYSFSSSPTFYTAGTSFKVYGHSYGFGNKRISYAYIQGLPPVYKITPAASFDTTTYNTSTRPTSITGGNYGIVGDDGTINTITNNNQIINETNNTYYNPATGETSTIKDWSYNYEDRSYTITLEGGDTATITYGDENISITENNVVEGSTTVNNYTIYYMVEGSGDPAPSDSPSPSPSACPHTWTETSRTDPTCISPGSVSYSCSQCGKTKTETLKAKGHTWQVERTVQTTYDEQGNLVQQGYTIYQCAVCGEQYKDDQGTGPPGGVGDGTGDSPLDKDKLKSVMDLVLSIFEELPKLFGGFLDFLGVVFPYLPPEITLLLTFGIVAVVFIGIIKAVRR